MATLVFRITGDPASFKAAMGEVTKSLESANAKATTLSQKFSSIGSSLTLGLTAPVLAAGTALVKTAADMESLRLGLNSVATAADPLEKQLARLKEVAKLPGLGFKEAIQGSVALQSAGFSASLAERSLKAFGNALATVGKGKADLDGVSLALGQIASKGKISAEEINQLAERVPQIRKAITAAFGTADTEVLQKAGIGATEFVTKVVTELEKLKQVTGGTKNSFENTADAIRDMADRIGSKLLPAVNSILPKFEALATGAADLVDGFTKLPPQIQNAALALGTLAIAAGPVLTIIGKISAAIGSLQAVAGAAGAALGGLFAVTAIAGITQTLSAIDALKQRYADLATARKLFETGKADPTSGLFESGRDLGKLKIDIAEVSKEFDILGKSAGGIKAPAGELIEAVAELTKQMNPLAKVTATSEILMRSMAEAVSKHAHELDLATDITRKYGTVNIDTAIALAKAADAQFVLNRALEEAPDLSQIIKLKDIVSPSPIDGLPTAQAKDGGDKNIGPEGMLTKEQADAIKDRYKTTSKTAQAAIKQVSTVLTDLSKGITDVIFKGGKIGDMFKSVASQAAQSITRLLIEGALTKLASKIIDVGGLFGKVFGGATSVGGSVFSAVGGAGASAAGSAGSSAASTAGSIAGSAVTGIVGAVAGVVGAISSVIGNFQMARQETTLNAIEHEVRYSQIHLLNTLIKANDFWPYMKLTWESLIRMEGRQANPSESGGGVTIDMSGAYLLSDSQLDDFADKFVGRLKSRGIKFA